MNRSTFIAALVAVFAIGGIIAAQVAEDSDDGDQTANASGAAGAVETEESDAEEDAQTDVTVAAAEAPPILRPAPDLVALDGWLQTERPELLNSDGTVSVADVDAPVKVVQFWTFSCINCKRTLDNLSGLYEAQKGNGLEVLGIHAPEFSFEEDPDAVAQAAQDLNVTWPIGLDTEKKNFRSWQESRRFWPRTYVIDSNNNIRFDHIGEGAYDELNETVAWLLENPGA